MGRDPLTYLPAAPPAAGPDPNPANIPIGESENAHREVYGQEKHESHLSHELIAGAASFAGMKSWEDHQRKEGMHACLDQPIRVPFLLSARLPCDNINTSPMLTTMALPQARP